MRCELGIAARDDAKRTSAMQTTQGLQLRRKGEKEIRREEEKQRGRREGEKERKRKGEKEIRRDGET